MKLKFNPLTSCFDMVGEDGISYVVEAANFAALPATGLSGVIYVTINNGVLYRWGGTQYSEVSASLALGETASTAYRGDRGKIAYDHSQITGADPHGSVTAQRVADLTSNSVLATPVDADVFPVIVGGGQRKTTWAVIKSTLKTYFDAIYAPAWANFTPTITSELGAFTAVSATCRYIKIGTTVHFNMRITITTVGTATGFVQATLPFAPRTAETVGNFNCIGINVAINTVLIGFVSAEIFSILNYAGTSPIAAGVVLRLSGTYESV